MRELTQWKSRAGKAAAVLAVSAFFVACSDSAVAPRPLISNSANADVVDIPVDLSLEGIVRICKETVGGTGSEVFNFAVTINGASAVNVPVAAGECVDVTPSSQPATVVIVEDAVTNWVVSDILIERMRRPGAADAEDETTRTATVFTGDDAGRIVTYTNTFNPPPPPGNEGCTPGFWKNHTTAWEGFTTGQTLGSIFTNTAPFASTTLLAALNFGGGSGVDGAKKILFRAAVAALLNSASSGVAYTMTTQEIIDAVNAALATGSRETILDLAGDLDADNNLGCPF